MMNPYLFFDNRHKVTNNSPNRQIIPPKKIITLERPSICMNMQAQKGATIFPKPATFFR